eukprot:scaffold3072_cov116-Isochrysis_galbana.AAC.12
MLLRNTPGRAWAANEESARADPVAKPAYEQRLNCLGQVRAAHRMIGSWRSGPWVIGACRGKFGKPSRITRWIKWMLQICHYDHTFTRRSHLIALSTKLPSKLPPEPRWRGSG